MEIRKKLLLVGSVTAALFVFGIHYLIPERVIVHEGEDAAFPPIVRSVTRSDETQLRLFGLVPVRTVRVSIVPRGELIPLGKAVGIRIEVGGVMVVGMSDVRTPDGRRVNPSIRAGLREGDVIQKISGRDIQSVKALKEVVEQSEAGELVFEFMRDGKLLTTSLSPAMSADDDCKKIGAWVKDSTSGIGTLTFVDPKTGRFGALGHSITDSDTGLIIPAKGGEILPSNIIGIKKGEVGTPGELKGTFAPGNSLGKIHDNKETGVFGVLHQDAALSKNRASIPTASRAEVSTGPAYILSNIKNDVIEQYEIEIQRVMRNTAGNKGMVIRITDQGLLEQTGGIVQGMSGSPIIQNGRLVGAVTHVFVNDPHRGYASFIDVML